jgi:hypothetical protein
MPAKKADPQTPAMKLVAQTRKLKQKGKGMYRTKTVKVDGVAITCIVFPTDAFQFVTKWNGVELKCVPMTRINNLLTAEEA